jgi:hypothetical protein
VLRNSNFPLTSPLSCFAAESDLFQLLIQSEAAGLPDWLGGAWRLFVGGAWRLLVVLGGSWWCLADVGGAWWLLVVLAVIHLP